MNYTKLFLFIIISIIPALSNASTAFHNRGALAKLDRTTREITHSVHEKIHNPTYDDLCMLNKVTNIGEKTTLIMAITALPVGSSILALTKLSPSSTNLSFSSLITNLAKLAGTFTLFAGFLEANRKINQIRTAYHLPPAKPVIEKA